MLPQMQHLYLKKEVIYNNEEINKFIKEGLLDTKI